MFKAPTFVKSGSSVRSRAH